MKVLVLGLPRTGTQSLADALEHLGYGPVYHMREVGKNSHAELWSSAIDAKFNPSPDANAAEEAALSREGFDKMLKGYEGLADYPAAIFPSELIAAYPEASVILSTRDEDGWMQSMERTLIHLFTLRPKDDPSPVAAMARKYAAACWGDDFAQNGRGLFRRHNEEVKSKSEGRQFLELRPGEGWEPLCRFLGVAVPEGVPYPRSDEWVAYKKKADDIES